MDYFSTVHFTFVATNRSRICSTKVNKDLLNSLKGLAEQFKTDVASLLVRKRYLKQQKEKRQEMLGLSDRGSKTPDKVLSLLTSQSS